MRSHVAASAEEKFEAVVRVRMKVTGLGVLSLVLIACAAFALNSCGRQTECGVSVRTVARSDLGSIAEALNHFAADHSGQYPVNLTDLLSKDEGTHGYVLRINLPPDPWRRPHIYTPTADRRAFKLMSYGSDGVPGGRGDAEDLSIGSSSAEH